ASKRHLFKAVNDGFFHLRREFFVRCKRQHPTGVFVFEIKRINQIACLVGISPHHFGRFFFTPFTLFIGHVFGRPCTPTCTVTREPHNHLANSFISRSMAIRWLTTCTASAPPLWVFTHRAIMFRLALMRLSIATLSRSSLRLRILTLPKWSLTTSDMVMLADSAKSCRACHSASENRTRSMLFRVVMLAIIAAIGIYKQGYPMLLHFVPHMWPCHWSILPPLTPHFGLRPAPPFGRCTPTDAAPQGALSVRHVAGVQVAAALRFALPAPMPKRWVTPKASSAFAA